VLEASLLELALKCVEAREAQDGGEEQSEDHVCGRDLRSLAPILDSAELPEEVIGTAVLDELSEPVLGSRPPVWQLRSRLILRGGRGDDKWRGRPSKARGGLLNFGPDHLQCGAQLEGSSRRPLRRRFSGFFVGRSGGG
jgi:hypothetical protein